MSDFFCSSLCTAKWERAYGFLLPAVVALGRAGGGVATVQALPVHGGKHDLQGVQILPVIRMHEGWLSLAVAVPVL